MIIIYECDGAWYKVEKLEECCNHNNIRCGPHKRGSTNCMKHNLSYEKCGAHCAGNGWCNKFVYNKNTKHCLSTYECVPHACGSNEAGYKVVRPQCNRCDPDLFNLDSPPHTEGNCHDYDDKSGLYWCYPNKQNPNCNPDTGVQKWDEFPSNSTKFGIKYYTYGCCINHHYTQEERFLSRCWCSSPKNKNIKITWCNEHQRCDFTHGKCITAPSKAEAVLIKLEITAESNRKRTEGLWAALA